MNNVYLIGMPGAGKSTAARIVSEHTGYPALDIDSLIVEKTGKTIPEIFKDQGESRFRQEEREVLRSCANLSGHIIACGGGIVLDPRNIELMRESGRIIFIDRPLGFLLAARIAGRPLISAPGDIERIYSERVSIYRACADHTVTGDNILKIAGQIESIIINSET
jgi:shikimate dehydrogenase